MTGGALQGVHILNSCAVTQEATKEVLRQARWLKRKNPDAKIVLTGCAAQVDGDLVDSEEAIDLVIGNSHKAEVPALIEELIKGKIPSKVHRANIFRKDDLGAGGGEEENHSRAFLKIQDGCNSFCSFCVIPYARGLSRSLTVNQLIERVHELQHRGYQEVVLTGVHIGDYLDQEMGRDLRLEDLVENLLNFTSLPRFRLTSLEPIEITERLLDLFQNDRLCPHVHLSLQSAHTGVLKAMKRKYTSEDVESAFERITAKIPTTPFIGMDVIVGFPGETEKDFQETYDRLQSLPWNHIHVFPYSERQGTKAQMMGGSVPWAERKRRAKALRELSVERYKKTALDQVGKTKKVLLSKKISAKNPELVQSVARDFWKVQLPVRKDISGQLEQEVLVQGFDQSPSSPCPPLVGRWLD